MTFKALVTLISVDEETTWMVDKISFIQANGKFVKGVLKESDVLIVLKKSC